MTEQMNKILVVDDHPGIRRALKDYLERIDALQVVGDIGRGADLPWALQTYRPDLIILDLELERGHIPANAVAQIRELTPEAKIVVLTTFGRDDYVYQGVRAGALGFLLKDAPVEHLIETIRRVRAGEVFIQPEIASRMLRELISPQAMPIEPLSEREQEVLVLLAQGHSNREIADSLVLAEGTIKNHVSNILSKLQAENRTQAADIARRYGLI